VKISLAVFSSIWENIIKTDFTNTVVRVVNNIKTDFTDTVVRVVKNIKTYFIDNVVRLENNIKTDFIDTVVRVENNIKTYFIETVVYGVEWINFAHDRAKLFVLLKALQTAWNILIREATISFSWLFSMGQANISTYYL